MWLPLVARVMLAAILLNLAAIAETSPSPLKPAPVLSSKNKAGLDTNQEQGAVDSNSKSLKASVDENGRILIEIKITDRANVHEEEATKNEERKTKQWNGSPKPLVIARNLFREGGTPILQKRWRGAKHKPDSVVPREERVSEKPKKFLGFHASRASQQPEGTLKMDANPNEAQSKIKQKLFRSIKQAYAKT